MPNTAKLFHIADIIFALTGIPIRAGKNCTTELYSHLLGYHGVSPEPFPEASVLHTLLKRQLPDALAECSARDIAELVVQLKMQFGSGDFRSELMEFLEKKFGKTIVVCAGANAFAESESLRLLKSLTETPLHGNGPAALPSPIRQSFGHFSKLRLSKIIANKASDEAA